jgi:NADH dehydrogenase
VRDLESLGVQVWTSSAVTDVSADAVEIGSERIAAATTLWAAGVEAAKLRTPIPVETDRLGRIVVQPDLSLTGHPEVFAAGDLAHVAGAGGQPLPGVAPVALQQGRHIGRAIVREVAGKARGEFRYFDKGQMATIGRSRAIVEIGRLRFAGFFAWLVWLVVHIYYLVGFKNRVFVVIQWAWAYLTFRRGARLIVGKEWRFNQDPEAQT